MLMAVWKHREYGSLADQSQMEVTVKDGVLEITNIADFNHEFALTHNGYGGVDRFKSWLKTSEGYQSNRHGGMNQGLL